MVCLLVSNPRLLKILVEDVIFSQSKTNGIFKVFLKLVFKTVLDYRNL